MDRKNHLRKSVLNYALPLSMIGGSLATLKAYASFDEPAAFILPLIMTLLLSFYYYLFKRGFNNVIIAFLTVATVFLELIIKEQYTTVGLGIYFWIFIFPLAIFAFFTPLKSLLLNVIFISIFIAVHHDGIGEVNPDYFVFPLAFSYFTVTLFNYIYQRYQDKQANIITEKTKALNQLNFSLQDRIKKAVQESQSKDKILEQQAKMAQMGELLSMIAHQWRQPLGSIASTAISLRSKIELEKYDLSKADEREEFLQYLLQKLDNIENYTNSLSTTIDDFKNFHNPQKELFREDISIPIKKAIDIMQNAFHNHNITLIESYHDNYIIEHYPNEIMQVILNILNNAHGNFKEKSIQNPLITLKVKEQGEAIMIEIGDNGGGIDESIITKIFDPYFSTKNEKNGTGLGLYMSKTIIEKHHQGRLSVRNKNGGATFTILLPKVLKKSS